MGNQECDIGMVGLGTMGRNLALNMADHGFLVAGLNKDKEKVAELEKDGPAGRIRGSIRADEFIGLLKRPRAVMMLVPAGPPVDSVINSLLPFLEPGDLIIDGGNSHFKDTDEREKMLAGKGIHFLGVGISGGEKGARYGPSMMPGGAKEAYEAVRPVFEAVAAKVGGDTCVTYLGPGSAGHYVKMVHNGIEYGIIQLISEAYDLLKRGLGYGNDQLHDIFSEWDKSELQSFLIEITADIFRQVDEKSGKRLIDLILDEARQKGTGKWTTQDAMDLQVPIPTIDAAVAMRDLSIYKSARKEAETALSVLAGRFNGDKKKIPGQLRKALYFSMITTYAQGMAMLRAASNAYGYGTKLADVARIWRGGCIIRSRLLDDIMSAFESREDLPNLMLDGHISRQLLGCQADLRQVVHFAIDIGIPAPALMASLGYFDGYRSGWLPANLVQAQRDYFGAHTYERIDANGVFHTEWGK